LRRPDRAGGACQDGHVRRCSLARRPWQYGRDRIADGNSMQSHNYIDFARAARQKPPRVAIVLGSGLAGIARRLQRARSISFAELPGVEPTSVAGHTGVLFAGEWAGRPVLIFGGRLHFYEGRTWDQVVAPMGLAASLGARLLVLTNAAGGIHEALGPGSLMGIRDHLEWARPNRWQLGTGLSPYSGRLLHGLSAAAAELGITLRQGVYAAVTGPCYETPAE